MLIMYTNLLILLVCCLAAVTLAEIPTRSKSVAITSSTRGVVTASSSLSNSTKLSNTTEEADAEKAAGEGGEEEDVGEELAAASGNSSIVLSSNSTRTGNGAGSDDDDSSSSDGTGLRFRQSDSTVGPDINEPFSIDDQDFPLQQLQGQSGELPLPFRQLQDQSGLRIDSELLRTGQIPAFLQSAPVDFAALKADRDLMKSLGDYLSRYGIKLPQSLITRVDETDLCSDNALDGLKYYCLKMEEGQYHDPWNPWCGYIECRHGTTVRRCCRPGTWMGMGRRPGGRGGTGESNNVEFMTKDDMCRRPLQHQVLNRTCVELTDSAMCNKVKDVELTTFDAGEILSSSSQSQPADAKMDVVSFTVDVTTLPPTPTTTTTTTT